MCLQLWWLSFPVAGCAGGINLPENEAQDKGSEQSEDRQLLKARRREGLDATMPEPVQPRTLPLGAPMASPRGLRQPGSPSEPPPCLRQEPPPVTLGCLHDACPGKPPAILRSSNE